MGNTMTRGAVRDRKTMVANDLENNADVLFHKKHFDAGHPLHGDFPLVIADEVVAWSHCTPAKANSSTRGAQAAGRTDQRHRLRDGSHREAGEDRLLRLLRCAHRPRQPESLSRAAAQYIRIAHGSPRKLALYLIDLERFKNINDSLGRPAGDALLRQVADWLIQNVGDANLLARVGADHFGIVLPNIKRAGDAVRLLEKTMQSFLNHPFRLDDAVFRISAKTGVALFPDDGADADTLFKNAESALKNAKAGGDRYLCYAEKMSASVAGRLTMENRLRQALERNEFVLHYQPKVNIASGRLTGCEALLRWNDPQTGLVPPGRFIPILEETGLIHDVGRWALIEAMQDHRRWCKAGLPAVRIAVNVSPMQLRDRGFITEIEQTIGTDARAAAGLELEITESLIMEDVRYSIASLRALRALGVTIAIDDFGTGFSSLSYLARLPVNTLKIDRSFIIDMGVGPEGLALVSTIINLAHSLKLNVVAEGVETEEQSRLLRLLDCDEMQGFMFSKPLPREIFETRYLVSKAAS